MVERFLGLVGETGPPPRTRLEAFRLYLLLHLAAESWAFATEGEVAPAGWGPVVATAHTLLFVACLAGRARRALTLAALVLLGVQIASTWPATANHLFLALWCLGLLVALDAQEHREGALLLQALRWLAVIVLGATGLQKLLYGTCFRGQFLAFVVAEDERFAALFRHFVPASDLARLAAIGPPEPGAGPYLVDSIPFVLASNAVWILELVIPALLLHRRTRSFATTAALLFLVGIESGARELFFGCLFVNLVLLFYDADVNRRLLPVFGVLLGLLVALRLWLLPGWGFN
jgi:hypothetical protein